MSTPVVTSENLDTLTYTPARGTRYMVAEGCERTMLKPTISMDREYSRLVKAENIGIMDPEHEGYWINVRLAALNLVTEGDDLPGDLDELDLDVVSRVYADFFTLRIAKAEGPLLSSLPENSEVAT